jgi:hypothetical protein
MGGCPIKRETIVWLALIAVMAIDFGLTFFGVSTNRAQELNPFTKTLWLDPYGNLGTLFLYTFISTPFMFYGIWTFWGKNNKYLYFNIAYYLIIIANNIRVALL